MRGTIIRMISNGSLAAFSASASNGRIVPQPPTRPPDIVKARVPASPPSRGQSAAPTNGGQPAPAPGQIVPRGSLLDLSV